MDNWNSVEEMLSDPSTVSPTPTMAPLMCKLAREALEDGRPGAAEAARETIERARRHGAGGQGRRDRINEAIASVEALL